MSLSLLTKRDAVLAAIQEFDELGRERFLEKYGFGESPVQFRTSNGRRYDAKLVLAAAVGKEHPARGPLRPDEFRASVEGVGDKLDEFGFSVLDVYEESEVTITQRDLELIKSSRTKQRFDELSDDVDRAHT